MIGVFDSGYGGLGVLRHIRAALPRQDLIYLGDSGRAPYGGRDVHTLLDFSEQAVERLFEEGCRLIVVACHTVSCVALRHLQRRYCGEGSDRRILGVTIPACELAVRTTRGRLGILATDRTVRSGTWATELSKLDPSLAVQQRAAPLLVGLVEEGWEDSEIARLAARRYLATFDDVDTIVLGCTHFPLLRGALEAALPPGVRLLDPGAFVAERLADWLWRHPGFASGGEGRLRVLCTGDPADFAHHGERFLGETLPPVHHVAEVAGRLAHAHPSDAPKGQVVR